MCMHVREKEREKEGWEWVSECVCVSVCVQIVSILEGTDFKWSKSIQVLYYMTEETELN